MTNTGLRHLATMGKLEGEACNRIVPNEIVKVSTQNAILLCSVNLKFSIWIAERLEMMGLDIYVVCL